MFNVDSITGDIELHQGDTGEYIITDVYAEDGTRAYFEVQDAKRKKVGSQISTDVYDGMATFKFNASLTDLFVVKSSEETAEYYGGIKLCDNNNNEETIKVGNKQPGERIIITVYPKEVEGDN